MSVITLPQPAPPTLAAIITALPEPQALRILERLTGKDDVGRWNHTAERVASELSLADYPVSASTIRTWRRQISFQESVKA
jgi:DNA-binding transcriptional ArsR family regulator